MLCEFRLKIIGHYIKRTRNVTALLLIFETIINNYPEF